MFLRKRSDSQFSLRMFLLPQSIAEAELHGQLATATRVMKALIGLEQGKVPWDDRLLLVHTEEIQVYI